MTFFDADSVSVPFEDLLMASLRQPEEASFYLFDAFEDASDRHAIMNALKDIIRANRDAWILPLLAVYFSVGRKHINANRLEEIIDFMEEELNPDMRIFLTNSSAFKALRKVAADYRRYGSKVKFNLNIDLTKKSGPGEGMQLAQNALETLFSGDESQAILQQMQKVLAPAA